MSSKSRSLRLAAFLSLCGVGLGQVYNAEIRKALGYWGIFALLILAVRLSSALDSFAGLTASFSCLILLLALTMFDASRSARRKGCIELRWYNVWYVYFLVSASFFFVPLDRLTVALFGYEAVMLAPEPGGRLGFLGDFVMLERISRHGRIPRRGDLALVTIGTPPARQVVRIVAIPRDAIDARDGQILVNGAPPDLAGRRFGALAQGALRMKLSDDSFLFATDKVVAPQGLEGLSMHIVALDRILGTALYDFYSIDDPLGRMGRPANDIF